MLTGEAGKGDKMLTNIKYTDLSQYPLTKNHINTFCAKCDHILKLGETVYKIDGATLVHRVCPSMPLRRFSDTRRDETKARRYKNGTMVRYEKAYTVKKYELLSESEDSIFDNAVW